MTTEHSHSRIVSDIQTVTNAALDAWEDIDLDLAEQVLASTIDILTDELAAFRQSQAREAGGTQ